MSDKKPVPTSPKVKAEQELEKLYSANTEFDRPPRRRIDWLTSIIAGLLAGVAGSGLLWMFADDLGVARFLPSVTKEKEVIIRETQETTSEQKQLEEALNGVKNSIVSIYPKEPASAGELASVMTPFDYRGSGVVLTSDGWILTTRDVIRFPEVAYVVVFSDGRIADLTNLQVDEADNLVLGRVDASDLPVATFATRGDVSVGNRVWLIDRPPTSSSYHVRTSTVSDWSYRAVLTDEDVMLFSDTLSRRIRLDNSADDENTGSVAVLADGTILGFVDRTGDATTVHVPYRVDVMVRSIAQNARVVRSSLDAYYYELSDTIGLSETVTHGRTRGAVLLLDLSSANSAAVASGLRDRDVVISVNGDELTDRESLSEAVLKHDPESTVPFVVLRAGQEQTVNVKLGE